MSSSANRPDDGTIDAGTDWLEQVSVAARGLAASHERLTSSARLTNEPRLAGISISLDPGRDRFLHSEVAPAPLSPLEIRPVFVLTGFLLSVALTAVAVITQLGHTDKASQPALGRGIERGTRSMEVWACANMQTREKNKARTIFMPNTILRIICGCTRLTGICWPAMGGACGSGMFVQKIIRPRRRARFYSGRCRARTIGRSVIGLAWAPGLAIVGMCQRQPRVPSF
jgi:hypothetical protein